MMKPIPYGRQNITQEDINAVIEVLKSDYLTQGPKIAEFETEFAKYVGAKFAVAVSNGTAALHLCALALEINPEDKVITTPITFAATANCVRYAGGDVIFTDIDSNTYLLDIQKVKELLKGSPKGTYKGIIVVDFAGRPVNLELFRELADEYGCWIIEDACHAPGGYFLNKAGRSCNCGSGTYADLSIFSFHPVKHIATGEGGMITTNNEPLYNKLKMLRTHGIQQNPDLRINNHGPWYYEMQILGYNYRLTDFQAALGISQLKRADNNLLKRKKIARLYEEAFSGKPYIIRQTGTVEGHAYHLYVVEFDKRDELYRYMRSKNITVQVHYIPLHLMPYYMQFGYKPGDMPVAEKYYKNCLSLPMYPTLSEIDLEYTINTVLDFYK